MANRSNVAAIQSARTAQAAILLTHRPNLKVRAMVVNIPTVDTQPNGSFLIATNVGGVDATLIKMYVQWIVAKHLPMENPMHSALDRTTQPMTIPSGAFVKLALTDFAFGPNDSHDVSMGSKYLFVFGYLKYTDPNKTLRRTYFCRRYDRDLCRFIEEDNPDYNYTD